MLTLEVNLRARSEGNPAASDLAFAGCCAFVPKDQPFRLQNQKEKFLYFCYLPTPARHANLLTAQQQQKRHRRYKLGGGAALCSAGAFGSPWPIGTVFSQLHPNPPLEVESHCFSFSVSGSAPSLSETSKSKMR